MNADKNYNVSTITLSVIDFKSNQSLTSLDTNYDPHDHRVVKNPTNTFQTFAHFLKASIGTGVLAMSYAFANAGYVEGIICTTIIGIIAVHCLHILIGSMYEVCKLKRVPYLTYSEAMRLAVIEGPPCLRFLRSWIRAFIDGFLSFYHFGICCVYVVFIAESIKQIMSQNGIELSLRIHICIAVIPLVLIFSIRNFKKLARFSSFANFLLVFGFGVIIYYIVVDLPPLSERQALKSINKFPIFFGTVLFALEAVGVILAIEENMAKPKTYLKPFGVLNVGMAIVLSLYMAIGFLGYWQYGDESLGSITLNIPQDQILAQVVKGLFVISTCITYALQGYVTISILWFKYLSKRVSDTSKHTLYELLCRYALVLLTFLAALAIPNLSGFISLVGALCLSFLGLIFPALIQICVQYRTSYGPGNIWLIKNILLVVFGLLGGIIGTYTSIIEITNA